MRVTVKVDKGKPGQVVWDAKASRAVAEKMVTLIKERTAMGLSATGDAFKPYSAAYAKATGKTTPDLKQTGTMLASIKVTEADEDEATVAVGTEYAPYVDAERPFMGLTQAEADKLMVVVGAEFDRITKED